MINWPCPSCGHTLAVDPARVPAFQRCTECGREHPVPFQPAASAPAPSPSTSLIYWNCPHCRQELSAPSSEIGSRQSCPACNKISTAAPLNPQPGRSPGSLLARLALLSGVLAVLSLIIAGSLIAAGFFLLLAVILFVGHHLRPTSAHAA